MNKIAAVSMIKNEADIVESFARHVLKIADLLIVTDHNSTDKTRQILESLQSEGLPIIIQTFDKIELLHEEIINSMVEQAIELEADIVIPIDADEFLIKLDGNSNDIRRILQNLDPEKCYLIPWRDYALLEPEKNRDEFTLSRELAFVKANTMNKVIVGSRSYLENDLYVIRGNHNAVKKSSIYGNFGFESYTYPTDEEIKLFDMHVPVRSQEQFELKNLTMGITQTASFSKNSFYGEGYKEQVKKFFSGEKISVAAESDSKPIDLSQYRNECSLKYTDGVIDHLQNIYLLAEDLADRYNRMQTMTKKILVSIFVLHYGDAEETISTLDSIFKQTYEPIEIFVMPVVENDLDRLVNWGESIPNYLELIEYDLPKAIENSRGKYLQFVTAGDILKPETIEKFVCKIEPQYVVRILASVQAETSSDEMIFSYYKELLKFTLDQNFAFDVGISSMFYRREFVPDSLKFFIDNNMNAHGMRLLIESAVGGMAGLMREDLIDLKDSKIPWTDEDRKIFEQDLNFLRRQDF